jgi:hypothetical protein
VPAGDDRFSAIATAMASALPPILFLKLTVGEFPASFTSKSIGAASLKEAAGNTVTCDKTKDTGTFGNAGAEKKKLT